MNHFELTKHDFRNIILGKTTYRKCPLCDNDGMEYWDENGMSPSPFPRPEWGEDYNSGECENCNGLGFVESINQ